MNSSIIPDALYKEKYEAVYLLIWNAINVQRLHITYLIAEDDYDRINELYTHETVLAEFNTVSINLPRQIGMSVAAERVAEDMSSAGRRVIMVYPTSSRLRLAQSGVGAINGVIRTTTISNDTVLIREVQRNHAGNTPTTVIFTDASHLCHQPGREPRLPALLTDLRSLLNHVATCDIEIVILGTGNCFY